MCELHPDPGLLPRTCRGRPSRRNPLWHETRNRLKALLDAPADLFELRYLPFCIRAFLPRCVPSLAAFFWWLFLRVCQRGLKVPVSSTSTRCPSILEGIRPAARRSFT